MVSLLPQNVPQVSFSTYSPQFNKLSAFLQRLPHSDILNDIYVFLSGVYSISFFFFLPRILVTRQKLLNIERMISFEISKQNLHVTTNYSALLPLLANTILHAKSIKVPFISPPFHIFFPLFISSHKMLLSGRMIPLRFSLHSMEVAKF